MILYDVRTTSHTVLHTFVTSEPPHHPARVSRAQTEAPPRRHSPPVPAQRRTHLQACPRSLAPSFDLHRARPAPAPQK